MNRLPELLKLSKSSKKHPSVITLTGHESICKKCSMKTHDLVLFYCSSEESVLCFKCYKQTHENPLLVFNLKSFQIDLKAVANSKSSDQIELETEEKIISKQRQKKRIRKGVKK